MDDYATFYDDLGVAEDASADQIRAAYYAKIKEYHPDTFQKSPEWVKRQAEETTKGLIEAYKTLIDPENRKIYDERLSSFREDLRRAEEAESHHREEEERLRREAADRLRKEEEDTRHREEADRHSYEATEHRRSEASDRIRAEEAERSFKEYSDKVRSEQERRRRLIFGVVVLGGIFAIVVGLVVGTPDRTTSSDSITGQIQWESQVENPKLASPIDLDADGWLDEVVLVGVDKKTAEVSSFNANGVLQWQQHIDFSNGPIKNLTALHIAPLNTGSDSHYRNTLVTLEYKQNGVTFDFNIILNGQGKADQEGKNCIDSLKNPLYFGPFCPGTLKYMHTNYGYTVHGKYIDETFGKVDIDGNNTWNGTIVLGKNRVAVYRDQG